MFKCKILCFFICIQSLVVFADNGSFTGEYHNRFNCINKKNNLCTKYLVYEDLYITQDKKQSYKVSISSKTFITQQAEWVPYYCSLDATAIYKDGDLYLTEEVNGDPITNAKIIIKKDTIIFDAPDSEEIKVNCGVYADISKLKFSRKRKFTIKEINTLFPIK